MYYLTLKLYHIKLYMSTENINLDSVTLLGGLNEQTIPIIFESILLTYAGNHMIKEDFS